MSALEAQEADQLPEIEMPTDVLGLRFGEGSMGAWSTSPDGTTPWQSRLFGQRYGRQVEIRIGARDHGFKSSGAMVTWVRVSTSDWGAAGDRDGRVAADMSAPVGVEGVLGVMTAVPEVWRDVQIRGGAEGIVIMRKIGIKVHPQGYLYDLWLAERLADAIGAPALPVTAIDRLRVPYAMG